MSFFKRTALFLLTSTAALFLPSGFASQWFKGAPIVYPFYFGAQFGYSSVNYTNADLLTGFAATSIKDSGTAIRVLLGYDYNDYLGAELSVIYAEKPIFNAINGSTLPFKIKNNVVSLVAKVGLPICPHFRVYAKGGVGYVVRNGITFGTVGILKEAEIFTPVYGVGAAFNFHKHWDLTASWMQAAAQSSDQLPTTNFFGIGGDFRFGF